jgi:hypothetical protein
VLGNKAGALWQQDNLPTYNGELLYLIKKPTERNDVSKAAEEQLKHSRLWKVSRIIRIGENRLKCYIHAVA